MKGLTRRHLFILMSFIIFSLAFLPSIALADNFPSKPVTMIVPYKAGGSTDTMARVLAKALKNELGEPVVVVNRKGGGGSVGASYLKNSAPDGYTFMLGGDDIVTWNPLVQKVEFKKDDFRYLAAIAEYQNAIITLNDKPYKTLTELVEYSKSHPGIRCAYQTPLDKNLIDTILKKENLDWTLVSTTGGGEAMQFLLGDKIDVTYSGGAHNQYRGKITVLASFNKNRLAGDPDVPTLKELGYGLSMPSYIVFMTPAEVPDDIAEKLEKAILQASQNKDFKTIVEERLKSPIIKVTSKELESYMTNLEKELKALQSE